MPSPKAKVEQRVGLTDITIEYSRPSAKGRKIFGELVPYGEPWRTGANKNTTIEINTSIMIGEQILEQGKYSLFTIPAVGKWVIIFNKDTENWGTSTYKQDQDMLRVDVEDQEYKEFVETFTINIANIRNESAEIELLWENTSVSIPFTVDVKTMAEANISRELETASEENLWKVYRNAAGYYYNNKMKLKLAGEYMDKSLELNSDSWYSHWLNAEILVELKEYKKAIKSAEEAIEVGEKANDGSDSGFPYKSMIEKSIKNWEELKKKK